MQETGTRLEQEREEARITQAFLRKIKGHEDRKSEGEDLQLGNILKLRDKWYRMYEWFLVYRQDDVLRVQGPEKHKTETGFESRSRDRWNNVGVVRGKKILNPLTFYG